MTAPVIPNDLVYPVRGEDRTVFANKANTFNQRLVDEVVPQLNALGTWSNDTAVNVSNDAIIATNKAMEAQVSSINSATSASNALTSANNASNSLATVIETQQLANSILGAGVGTTYLQDGDLYITYIEATVNNVSINPDGLLVIETV